MERESERWRERERVRDGEIEGEIEEEIEQGNVNITSRQQHRINTRYIQENT